MGERIEYRDGRWVVPSHPIIPFIEGDGTGPDIWRAARRVFDATVRKVSGGKRQIDWLEVLAGEKAFKQVGSGLPDAPLDAIGTHRVAIKGPLTTPVGGGIRSLNVTLRQVLDLYACIRPVRYFEGVPSPMREPQKLDVVIFRENIEDVYSGIEYRAGSSEADAVIGFLTERFGAKIRPGSAIGIKPMSKFGSQRLVAKAIEYALRAGRRSVTLVHKGNIMKFTEGGFREWGYEIAKEKFAERTVPESEAGGGKGDGGRVIMKDRITDAMFAQLVLRPDEHSVIAGPHPNGEPLSHPAAPPGGWPGLAPALTQGGAVPASLAELDRAAAGIVGRAIASGDFKGKRDETALLYPSGAKPQRLLLVGLGKPGDVTRNSIRRAAAVAAKRARALGTTQFAFALAAEARHGGAAADVGQVVVRGGAQGAGAFPDA